MRYFFLINKKSESGVALLMAMFVLSFIVLIAASFSLVVIRELTLVSGAAKSYRAIYSADAGSERALDKYLTSMHPTLANEVCNSSISQCGGVTYNVLVSSTPLSIVIKSTGEYLGTKRAVEVVIPLP